MPDSSKATNLVNGNGISHVTAPQVTSGFNFLNKTSALNNGGEEKPKKVEEPINNSNNNTKNNINEIELLFLNDLNDLYQRHYGSDSKRIYKLPSDSLINCTLHKDENTHDSSASSQTKYAFLLSELNKHCSKWISKHVEESPHVILTPIFVDYINYLILLEKQFYPSTFNDKLKSTKNATATNTTNSMLNGKKIFINS